MLEKFASHMEGQVEMNRATLSRFKKYQIVCFIGSHALEYVLIDARGNLEFKD